MAQQSHTDERYTVEEITDSVREQLYELDELTVAYTTNRSDADFLELEIDVDGVRESLGNDLVTGTDEDGRPIEIRLGDTGGGVESRQGKGAKLGKVKWLELPGVDVEQETRTARVELRAGQYTSASSDEGVAEREAEPTGCYGTGFEPTGAVDTVVLGGTKQAVVELEIDVTAEAGVPDEEIVEIVRSRAPSLWKEDRVQREALEYGDDPDVYTALPEHEEMSAWDSPIGKRYRAGSPPLYRITSIDVIG